MHHVESDEFVEPGADREDAGLDHGLVDLHGRRRRIGIVDGKFVGAGSQTRRGIEVLDHLKIIDVDVDRMLVVVVVDEPPLLDRVEPCLHQRNVGNAPPSNAYTNAFGSSVLAMLLRNPPEIRIRRLTSGVVLARSTKAV